MQMQLWLSLTPSSPGLMLLEGLEGEESIAHPLTRASWQGKGNGKGDSPFFSLNFLHQWGVQGFGGSWSPLQGAVCSEENMTSQIFSIPGSYDLQFFFGLHWNGSSANGFRTTNSAFHSTSLPRASGWEESAGIMAVWNQFQSTQ